MDLCVPSIIHTTRSKLYFMPIIDDYNKLIWVAFFKEKSEAFEKFKNFKAMDENETNYKIKHKIQQCWRVYL